MLLELERRGYDVAYVRTDDGWEVDFLAHRVGEVPLLIQVCLETAADETWTREVRALAAAKVAHRTARALLVTGDATPPRKSLPSGLTWMSAAQWLLEE